MKHIICYLVLSLVALLVPIEVGLAQQTHLRPDLSGLRSAQAQPLGDFLNPDGTLHTPPGFSGSLDP